MVVCFLVQSISHGLHMSLGVLIPQIAGLFKQDFLCAGILNQIKYLYSRMYFMLSLLVLLGTVSLSFGLMFSPVAVSLCKRKSTRLIAVIGGLVTALGCLFTSFALQFHQMIFSFGKFLKKMFWMKIITYILQVLLLD